MVTITGEFVKLRSVSPRFYYVTGCDGTGKTTQAHLLVDDLRRQGRHVKHVWLRFPFFLCTPLLLYARLRKLSSYEQHDGKWYGYWDFSRSWLMKRVFPWVLLIDAFLAAVIRIYIPMLLSYSIVCERFVLDMLADLILAIKDPELARSLPGRWFLLLLPRSTSIVLLDLDSKTIRERRKDLRWDRILEMRIEVFRYLAQIENIFIITSENPIQEVNSQIKSRFRVNHVH